MPFSSNNQTSSVIVTQNQELHYISPERILPFGGLSSIFGLLAVMAIVAARKTSKSKTATLEYAYATERTTRSFNSKKFYERLDGPDPYTGQYDHWDIKEPQPRKSAKDMTREEILAEAGIKVE
jgi:hypothetical protein